MATRRVPYTTRLKIHPAADITAGMSESDFECLKADIQKHGCREPLTLVNGLLVDGRNRYRACRELGIDMDVIDVDATEDQVFSLVMSRNLCRRHLTPQQRTSLAAQYLSRLRRKPTNEDAETVVEQFHVAPSTARRAVKLAETDKRSLRAVANGKTTISEVAKQQRERVHRSPQDKLKLRIKEFACEVARTAAFTTNIQRMLDGLPLPNGIKRDAEQLRKVAARLDASVSQWCQLWTADDSRETPRG